MELQRQIDAAVRIQRWIRIDEATLRRMVGDGNPLSDEQKGEYLRLALYADEVDVVRTLLEFRRTSTSIGTTRRR